MWQSRCIKPTQHSACGKTEYFPCELSTFGIITTHLPSCCQHRVRHRPTIQSRAGCSLVKVQLGQQPGVCEMSTATQLLTSGHPISSRMLDCGQEHSGWTLPLFVGMRLWHATYWLYRYPLEKDCRPDPALLQCYWLLNAPVIIGHFCTLLPYWHRWFHEDNWTSMTYFHCRNGAL